MRASGNRRGVVLILLSGLVLLLVLLALAVGWMARSSAASSLAALAASRASLASESGLEYAAVRLAEDTLPRYARTSAGRVEDWISPDPAADPLDRILNPSYGRGEPWIDAPGGRDGAFDPAVETVARDLDGDGRFTAWSGRLRGGPGALSHRFLLRIACPEHRIPLNAGRLENPAEADGLDNDGDGTADEAWEGDTGRASGPVIPEHRDDGIPYHASLAQVLDNLGSLVGVTTRAGSLPTSGDPFAACWIGTDLIRNRPPGGYRSWSEVERTLLALPASPYNGDPYDAADYAGAPYTQADLEAIRPYVDLGPYEAPVGASRCGYGEGEYPPRYVPISLWVAPLVVMKAVWMYAGAGCPVGKPDFAGETVGRAKPCAQSGLPFDQTALLLFPEEAAALARETVDWRSTGDGTWNGLRERLVQRADVLFARDFADLGAGVATPYFQRSWAAAKAGLAWQTATMDPYPWWGQTHPLRWWGTRGSDAYAAGGFEPVPSAGTHLSWDSPLHRAGRPARFDPLLGGVGSLPYVGGERIRPQGFTLAPPCLFDVESAGVIPGADALRAGRLRAVDRLEIASQEDFEGLWEEEASARGWRTPLAGRGIALVNDLSPADRFDCRSGPSLDPAVVSVPRFPWRGIGRPEPPPPGLPYPENILVWPRGAFAMDAGGVTLATAEAGMLGAQAWWPFPADFIVEDRNIPGASHRELMPRTDPAYYDGGDLLGTNPRHRRPPVLDATAPAMMILPIGNLPPDQIFMSPQTMKGIGGSPLPGCHVVDETYKAGFTTYTFMHRQVRELAVSAWLGSNGLIRLDTSASNLFYVEARRIFEGDDPAKPGILYSLRLRASPLRLQWVSNPAGWMLGATGPPANLDFSVFVPDAGQPAGSRHVHLRLYSRFEGGDRWIRDFTPPPPAPRPALGSVRAMETFIELYVDGASVLSERIPTVLQVGGGQAAWVENADDLRVYATDALPPLLPDLDRYRREGRFLSCRYDVGSGSRLGWTRWEAVRPHGDLDRIRVFVLGYDTAGALLGEAELGPIGERADLRRLPFPARVRSFRFRAEFDSIAAPVPIREAPVFESVWFTFRRAGRSPWTSWTTR